MFTSIALGVALGDLAFSIAGPFGARRARTRRRRAAWLAATWASRRALPWSIAAASVTAATLAWRTEVNLSLTATLGGTAVLGVRLTVQAGRLEARGRRTVAVVLARLAGQVAFVGATAFALAGALAHPVPACFLALGGWVALLAGLSGKPRPAGALALALCATGLVSLVLL